MPGEIGFSPLDFGGEKRDLPDRFRSRISQPWREALRAA
jgi:hypothetical protein